MKVIEEKSCYKCKWLEYDEDCNSDGYVNESNSGYICCGDRHIGISNLKHFPFSTNQKCWEEK